MSKDVKAAKKTENPVSGIVKDTLIIFAITLVAGLVLGFVYELTKTPIDVQKLEKQAAACAEVFKEADDAGNLVNVETLSFKEIVVDENARNAVLDNSDVKADITEVYEARTEDEKLYGYVIAVERYEGYGGTEDPLCGLLL